MDTLLSPWPSSSQMWVLGAPFPSQGQQSTGGGQRADQPVRRESGMNCGLLKTPNVVVGTGRRMASALSTLGVKSPLWARLAAIPGPAPQGMWGNCWARRRSEPSRGTHPGVTPHVEPQHRPPLRTPGREELPKKLRGQKAEPLLGRVETGIVREVSERGGPGLQSSGIPVLRALVHEPSSPLAGRRHQPRSLGPRRNRKPGTCGGGGRAQRQCACARARWAGW